MPIKRVVIVHGQAANPTMNWFTDLATSLRETGYREVYIPWMPHPQIPDVQSWKRKLSLLVQDVPEETAIIGHSFGAITALRFADSITPDRMLGAVIVVSCPIKWVWGGVPARILYREPDWKRVRASVRNLAIIHSDNDWIAPVRNATYMQSKLGCEPFVVHGYGHLCRETLPSEAHNHVLRTFTQ